MKIEFYDKRSLETVTGSCDYVVDSDGDVYENDDNESDLIWCTHIGWRVYDNED